MVPAKPLLILALSTAGILLGFSGCEGPQGPAGPPGASPIYVSGKIEPEIWWPTWMISGPFLVRVDVSNAPSIPTVMVNGINISLNGEIEGDEFEFLEWGFPISYGDSAHLSVSYTRADGSPGSAEADVVLPDTFTISSPDPGEPVSIPLGTDLTVNWTTAAGADAYEFSCHLSYSYWDTLGNQEYFYLSLDTLIADTVATIASSYFYPEEGTVDSLDYSYGSLYLWAHSGPWQEGELGNVRGDGIGFFCGRTFGAELDIFVVLPN